MVWNKFRKIKNPKKQIKKASIFGLKHYKRGTMGYDKKFMEKYGKNVFSIYKLINKEKQKLYDRNKIKCEKTGAVIVQERTGSYAGMQNSGTFSVELNGKKFFLKIANREAAIMEYNGLKKAGEEIAKNWKQGKIRVEVSKPHLLYIRYNKNLFLEKSIIVSDFFNSKEYMQGRDFLTQEGSFWEKRRVFKTSEKLKKFLKKRGINDVNLDNMFYNPREKKIIVFDPWKL